MESWRPCNLGQIHHIGLFQLWQIFVELPAGLLPRLGWMHTFHRGVLAVNTVQNKHTILTAWYGQTSNDDWRYFDQYKGLSIFVMFLQVQLYWRGGQGVNLHIPHRPLIELIAIPHNKKIYIQLSSLKQLCGININQCGHCPFNIHLKNPEQSTTSTWFCVQICLSGKQISSTSCVHAHQKHVQKWWLVGLLHQPGLHYHLVFVKL